MPYIKNVDVDRLAAGDKAETPGELNFLITCAMIEYVEKHGLSYKTINDCLGAAEGAKLEFYRRIAAPYEEKKIDENGDVYPLYLFGRLPQRG